MKRVTFIISIFLIISSYTFGQGKLNKVKKGFSKNNSYTSSSRARSHSRTDRHTSIDTDYIWSDLVMVFIEVGLYATYYGLIESPVEQEHRAHKAFITKSPYYNSNKGNYAYNWGENTRLSQLILSNRFIIENSELYGNHINADFRFFRRISVEADYLQLWENNTFFGNNSLAIYTLIAKYHRVRTEKFNAYWGMGATYVADEISEIGFTYGIGAEYFFANPLSAELNYNQSFINTQSFDKLNILLNYHIHQFKVTGGYEYLKIGGIGFSTFSAGIGVFL